MVSRSRNNRRVVIRQPLGMSRVRFEELRAAGPTITAHDVERLSGLPRMPRSLMFVAVRVALLQMGAEAMQAAYRRHREVMRGALEASMKPTPGSETEAREARGDYEHRTYQASA